MAYWYFAVALLLFLLQVLDGLIIASLTLPGVAALARFVAANFHPTLWLTEGREYIEAPRWADWLIVLAVLMAFLLVKLTGADRDVVEKWLYVEVGLVLFTGIIGTGHHYYWIGTPRCWLLLGAVFSALETLPVGLMLYDTWQHTRHAPRRHANTVVWTWVVAGVIGHFLGAGVWGFLHTLPQVNQWTHGTQITAAHGHFAFFCVYAMLVIALGYFIVPELNGKLSRFNMRRSLWAFWLIVGGMLGLVISLTVARIVQVYLERMTGMDFIVVKTQYMTFWFVWRLIFGATAVSGVILFLVDFLLLSFGPEPRQVRSDRPRRRQSYCIRADIPGLRNVRVIS